MEYPGTLILTRSDIANLMTFRDYMDAVENAFLSLAAGQITGSGVLDIPGSRPIHRSLPVTQACRSGSEC